MNLAVDTMEQERLQGWLTVANSETGKQRWRSFVVIVLEIIFQSVRGYWRVCKYNGENSVTIGCS